MANKKPIKKTTTKKHLAREQREAKQTRMLLTITVLVGAIIVGLLAYGIIDQTLIRPRTPIAQVGADTITAREFESYVQYSRVQFLNQAFQYYSFYQQFGEFGESFLQNAQSIALQLNQPTSFGRDILDEMVDNLIILQEAEKRGITVSQAEIDEAVQAAFGFFPDGTPTPTVTSTIQPTPTLSETQLALITLTPTATVEPEEDLDASPDPLEDRDEAEVVPEVEAAEEVLIEQPDLEDEPEIPEFIIETPAEPEATPTITLTPTPYTEDLFRQNIRDFNSLYRPFNFDIDDLRSIFKVSLLRERLIDVIAQDLEPFKPEVWARHILVETLEEALEVLSLLEQGEDFHTLAETYSLDESNHEQGGNLGWFDENTMVMPFTEAAFSLAEGEISDPIETTFGYHIIQVLGKRETQIQPAEFRVQQQTVFTEWLTELRNTRDDIVIFDAWDQHVPITPEVPQQFLAELFQQ